jgi:5-methylcytosine-specific restriction protein A
MTKTYGEIAQGIIEVHHVRQIAEIGKSYQVDPINDLVPLCPNCHRVIHQKSPSFSVEEISAAIKKSNKAN